MSFSDHKITQFTHRISELADQPNMPADELKARFDACPEQLRVSLNAVCDEADRLDERVDSIVAGTFGDSIPKSMLSEELRAELDAKAVETSVASRFSAEQTARESADSALSTRVSSLESAVPQKCRVYVGTYTGNDAESRIISLGVRPKAVLVLYRGMAAYASNYSYGGLALDGKPVTVGTVTDPDRYDLVKIVSNGFQVYNNDLNETYSNMQGVVYHYIAFC